MYDEVVVKYISTLGVGSKKQPPTPPPQNNNNNNKITSNNKTNSCTAGLYSRATWG